MADDDDDDDDVLEENDTHQASAATSQLRSVSDTPPAGKDAHLQEKDAFILFNERELSVPAVVDQLQKLGVTIYFWRKDIGYGEKWIEREQKELLSCRRVLLFLGEKGWGPTHRQLAEEARRIDENKILPVLLPKATDEALNDAGGIFRDLRWFDLDPSSRPQIRALADLIQNSKHRGVLTNAKFGNLASITREASPEHAVLYVNEYAEVLASLIQSIDNKDALSFAILGPWGRGKTYLMDLVGKLLAKKSYTTVSFSAWKYRTTPELWSYLYETLYSQATKSGWEVPIRTGLLRRGLWPIIPLLLTLALSISTISQKANLAFFVLSLFGVMGVIYLLSVSKAFWKAGKSIKANYWDLPRHQDRLGLQFAIGDDLRALLTGWLPNAGGWNEAWKTVFLKRPLATLCYAVAALALWWIATEAAVLKASGYLLVAFSVLAFLVIALAVVLLPLWVLVRNVASTDRVLLVVDDLDRCHSGQMLEIVECLQLFLDDDEVKKRLKVVMLIEEDILRNALRQKYVDALGLNQNDRAQIDQLVNDNLEKLFLVWLRLEPLSRDETRTVFESVCASLGPSNPSESADGSIEKTKTDDGDVAVGVKVTPLVEPKMESAAGATEVKIDTPLSSDEVTEISSMVNDIIYNTNRERWSPRSVRSFVFRFQLARMLLAKLGKTYSTAEIVRAVATASDRQLSDAPGGIDELLFRIARQVS